MLIEALLSIIVLMLFIIYILTKRIVQFRKDREQWKANYFAFKSTHDFMVNKWKDLGVDLNSTTVKE